MPHGCKNLVRDQDLIDAVELRLVCDGSRRRQENELSPLSGCMRVIKPMHTDPRPRASVRPPPTDVLRTGISIERDGRETLADLLTRAAVALETDLHAAKTCIKHLAAMLGIELSLDGPAPAEHPCSRGGLAPWQANRVRSYIENNLGSNLRATDLAPIAHLSASHFFRTFRQTFGEAPAAYIMKRRIVHAQQRMLSSQVPLVEIALECGMCDQAHFTRVFRRIVGVNPKMWRRQFFTSPPQRVQSARESSGNVGEIPE